VRRSRKGTRYALVGFFLICAVVLGGMAWASSATWQLAKLKLEEDHLQKVRGALGRMDDYILGVLKGEASREYGEYHALWEPEIMFSKQGHDLDTRILLQPSPIATSHPTRDWVDLWFHVNEQGDWSSPHLPHDEELDEVLSDLVIKNWGLSATNRAYHALNWVRGKVSVTELCARLSAAIERDRILGASTDVLDAPPLPQVTSGSWPERISPVPLGRSRRPLTRRGSPLSLQQKYVPEPKCILEGASEREDPSASGERGPQTSTDVVTSTLVPLWLSVDGGEGPKIAFVRTAVQGSVVEYQGFIGEWARLKPELLRRIANVFPDADVEPVFPLAAEVIDPAAISENEMEQLPVRLVVPETATRANVWRSVRGVLLTSWTAAVVVLVLAGWGVRNLVALTDRRLQFAYAVTHELRTPLTTFRLYTDMLASGLVPESSKEEYLWTLNAEAQRLATLVEDVLEYARLENQKVRLTPSELEGRSLLDRLTPAFEERCKVNGVASRTQNDVAEGQPVHTDVDLVGQIAGVLVNNACRHARGSKDATVMLHLATENGSLQLDVVDTGPGIDRADARKIFKPFRRGRNADATGQGGIGLGLSLARSWASLLGGRLELVARQHPRFGGAHFRLTIPTHMSARE